MRIDWEEELDERLVQRMERGEGLAFVALATRYWNLVHRICSNLLPPAGEAREATEEIFLEIPLVAGAFPSDVPFKTSLLKVALRRILVRRRLAAAPGEGSVEGLPARFDGRPVRERIRDALRHLHELDHAAFVLREVEGIPREEVAAILEIPPQSVSQRTHRATLSLSGALHDLVSRAASSGHLRYAS